MGVVTRIAGVAVTLAVLALGATAGGSDDAEPPPATLAPADAAFCDAFGALIAGPLTDEGTDARDPVVLQTAVDVTRSVLDSLVEAAGALRSEAEELAAEYESGFSIWERYGYDLARVDAEATPEELGALDAFLAAPQGPGDADPLTALEDAYFERCAADVTLPPGLLTTTTVTSP